MKTVFINKNSWLENCQTDVEKQIVNKYLESKAYTEPEYTAIREVMIDEANKIDPTTGYIMSYYLSFDELYNDWYIEDFEEVK